MPKKKLNNNQNAWHPDNTTTISATEAASRRAKELRRSSHTNGEPGMSSKGSNNGRRLSRSADNSKEESNSLSRSGSIVGQIPAKHQSRRKSSLKRSDSITSSVAPARGVLKHANTWHDDKRESVTSQSSSILSFDSYSRGSSSSSSLSFII